MTDCEDGTVTPGNRVISTHDTWANKYECEMPAAWYQRFAAAMSYAHWQNHNMCDIPYTRTNNGQCRYCHYLGAGSVFLNTDCRTTYDANRREPYVRSLVAVRTNASGCVIGWDDGLLLTYDDPIHPPWNREGAYKESIQDFVLQTIIDM